MKKKPYTINYEEGLYFSKSSAQSYLLEKGEQIKMKSTKNSSSFSLDSVPVSDCGSDCSGGCSGGCSAGD